MEAKDILFDEVAVQNEKLLQELQSEIKDGEWMLCLGAGVSIAAGLPNWYGLLAKIIARLLSLEMCVDYKDKEKDKDKNKDEEKNKDGEQAYYYGLWKYCEKMNFDKEFLTKFEEAIQGQNKEIFSSINVLEAAEYIENFLKESIMTPDREENQRPNQEEKEKIHWYMNHLIQQACETDITVDSNNKDIQKSTLGAVAGLMKTGEDALIHNVITYNYDNLLEVYLRNISGCRPEDVHSIVKGDNLRDFGSESGWNIYHIHGRIPVIEHEKEPMSEQVILTESDYYLEEQINYSWTNILQSYALVKSRLIFIGFSGADYNFRRIMKYVSRENKKSEKKHYIFFLVDDIVEAVFNVSLKKEKNAEDFGKKDINIADCMRKMNQPGNFQYAFEKIYINYIIHAQTLYWENYGMKVIWSSRKNLAKDLNELH